jgi:hypothetical protein
MNVEALLNSHVDMQGNTHRGVDTLVDRAAQALVEQWLPLPARSVKQQISQLLGTAG